MIFNRTVNGSLASLCRMCGRWLFDGLATACKEGKQSADSVRAQVLRWACRPLLGAIGQSVSLESAARCCIQTFKQKPSAIWKVPQPAYLTESCLFDALECTYGTTMFVDLVAHMQHAVSTVRVGQSLKDPDTTNSLALDCLPHSEVHLSSCLHTSACESDAEPASDGPVRDSPHATN
jgi:hypothetical protein